MSVIPAPANLGAAPTAREPRICMPSWRNFRKVAYQGSLYEAQDVLADSGEVDLLCLDPGPHYRFREGWQRRILWHDFTKRLSYINPGLRPVRLDRDYDVFIATCQSWWDLLSLNAVKGWKERCRTSVCWMDEMWAAWVPRYKNWLHLMDQFDHIVLNLRGSVEAVEQALGRPCHWVPHGADALRFSPYPRPPERVIDVYSIGRRWVGVHQALLRRAEAGGFFYVYDTVNVNDTILPDHRVHRDFIASMAKRSRCFMVAPAKMDDPTGIGGQSEVGSRYFEGSASGAVLIGEKPEGPSFRELFDWEDSVIEIKTDGSDVIDVLSDLARHPERAERISRRNAAAALLRHDWAYRWKDILRVAGLAPGPALAGREARLRELAASASDD